MSERRRRVKQTRSLEERMVEQAAKLKAMADQLPAGAEREARRARIAETGAHINDWIQSPGAAAAGMSFGTNVHFDN